MKKPLRWAKTLLWLHLLVCVVWLSLFRGQSEPKEWMLHVFLWSILGVQFTWGFTIGLIVGPKKGNRKRLWWSLLTVFMPLFLIGHLCFAIAMHSLFLAAAYGAVFTMILACETYCGILLGAKLHSRYR